MTGFFLGGIFNIIIAVMFVCLYVWNFQNGKKCCGGTKFKIVSSGVDKKVDNFTERVKLKDVFPFLGQYKLSFYENFKIRCSSYNWWLMLCVPFSGWCCYCWCCFWKNNLFIMILPIVFTILFVITHSVVKNYHK